VLENRSFVVYNPLDLFFFIRLKGVWIKDIALAVYKIVQIDVKEDVFIITLLQELFQTFDGAEFIDLVLIPLYIVKRILHFSGGVFEQYNIANQVQPGCTKNVPVIGLIETSPYKISCV